MSNVQNTLSIIKPDAVERNLVDEIKIIFRKNNLEVKESKKIHITKEEAADLNDEGIEVTSIPWIKEDN